MRDDFDIECLLKDCICVDFLMRYKVMKEGVLKELF